LRNQQQQQQQQYKKATKANKVCEKSESQPNVNISIFEDVVDLIDFGFGFLSS